MIKDEKGSVLAWVCIMFFITSIVIAGLSTVIVGSVQRRGYRVDYYQGYYLAKSVVDVFSQSMTSQDDVGQSIVAATSIGGDFDINKINLPSNYSVSNTKVSFSSTSTNEIKMIVYLEYKTIDISYGANFAQKFILYDKDGEIVTDDYQGDLSGEDMEGYTIESYWVVSSYVQG